MKHLCSLYRYVSRGEQEEESQEKGLFYSTGNSRNTRTMLVVCAELAVHSVHLNTTMSLVQTAKDSLSSLFENLEDTPFCARCLLGASQKGIMEAQLAVGFKEFWAAITQDLRFWKSFMRFLFTPRTDSQTRTFLEQISHCSCRMSDRKIRGYHRFGRFLEQDLLARTCVDIQTSPIAFITNLFRTLTGALEGAHLKAVAKRMAVNWPTCPEDLMPFGPDKLIESIIMWSRFIPDIIVFRVASQCIRFCGALLIPSVIESGLTRHVVDAGRQLFDRTLTTLRLRAETRRKEMGHAFACQSEALLEYFIDFCEDQPIEKRMILYEKYELKATQIFAMLAYLADDPRLFVENRQSSTARLAYQAVGVYRALRHYIDPLPSLRLFPVVWDIVYDREEVEKEREEGGHTSSTLMERAMPNFVCNSTEHKEMLLLDAKQDPNLSVFDPGYGKYPYSYFMSFNLILTHAKRGPSVIL